MTDVTCTLTECLVGGRPGLRLCCHRCGHALEAPRQFGRIAGVDQDLAAGLLSLSLSCPLLEANRYAVERAGELPAPRPAADHAA